MRHHHSRFIPGLLSALLSCGAFAQPGQPALGTRLTGPQVKRDLAILRRALTDLHPGLYRYVTPAQFDSIFTENERPLLAGATRAELYLVATRIAAAVRCGHTWTNPLNQARAVEDELFGRADKLPFRLQLVEDRFLILASAAPDIAAGDELVSVQGIDAGTIVREMLPYLRADGSSDGKRRAQLSHGDGPSAMDGIFPLLHAPVNGRYSVQTRRTSRSQPTTRLVAATTVAGRDSAIVAAGDRLPDPRWTLTIAGDTALLTIPTFVVHDGTFPWKTWLREAFARLETQRTPLLLVDIRRNEGGTDEVVDTLLSYLLHRPFMAPRSHAESAYERVPYVLARFLETWDFGFFDRTGKVQKTTGRNYVFTDGAAAADTVHPSAHAYTGTAVVLVGPENSSSGYMFGRRAVESGAALVVGQPTGGNYRGLNGGELAWVTLPNSGVAVDIPLLAWMPDTPQPDRPVTPNVVVHHRFEDVQRGTDPDREAVRALVRRGQLPLVHLSP